MWVHENEESDGEDGEGKYYKGEKREDDDHVVSMHVNGVFEDEESEG